MVCWSSAETLPRILAVPQAHEANALPRILAVYSALRAFARARPISPERNSASRFIRRRLGPIRGGGWWSGAHRRLRR